MRVCFCHGAYAEEHWTARNCRGSHCWRACASLASPLPADALPAHEGLQWALMHTATVLMPVGEGNYR